MSRGTFGSSRQVGAVCDGRWGRCSRRDDHLSGGVARQGGGDDEEGFSGM